MKGEYKEGRSTAQTSTEPSTNRNRGDTCGRTRERDWEEGEPDRREEWLEATHGKDRRVCRVGDERIEVGEMSSSYFSNTTVTDQQQFEEVIVFSCRRHDERGKGQGKGEKEGKRRGEWRRKGTDKEIGEERVRGTANSTARPTVVN